MHCTDLVISLTVVISFLHPFGVWLVVLTSLKHVGPAPLLNILWGDFGKTLNVLDVVSFCPSEGLELFKVLCHFISKGWPKECTCC